MFNSLRLFYLRLFGPFQFWPWLVSILGFLLGLWASRVSLIVYAGFPILEAVALVCGSVCILGVLFMSLYGIVTAVVVLGRRRRAVGFVRHIIELCEKDEESGRGR
jgi:hypothetical protein